MQNSLTVPLVNTVNVLYGFKQIIYDVLSFILGSRDTLVSLIQMFTVAKKLPF